MFEIDKRKFGAFIAELRKEKGMTQKELAEKLFISDKAVSKWETAQSIPDITLLRPLAEILGVTTTELLECRRISEDTVMDAEHTEELLHKVMDYPEKGMEGFGKARKRDRLLFVLFMLIGMIESIFYVNLSGEPMWIVTGPSSVNFSNLVTIEVLCLIFGVYFCFFAKERLPYYYDEDRISLYSHGIFRMNLPGVHLNNSNWPHILKVAKIWCMATSVIFPLICIALWVLFIAKWSWIHNMFLIGILVGGFMIPTYMTAKKYE